MASTTTTHREPRREKVTMGADSEEDGEIEEGSPIPTPPPPPPPPPPMSTNNWRGSVHGQPPHSHPLPPPPPPTPLTASQQPPHWRPTDPRRSNPNFVTLGDRGFSTERLERRRGRGGEHFAGRGAFGRSESVGSERSEGSFGGRSEGSFGGRGGRGGRGNFRGRSQGSFYGGNKQHSPGQRGRPITNRGYGFNPRWQQQPQQQQTSPGAPQVPPPPPIQQPQGPPQQHQQQQQHSIPPPQLLPNLASTERASDAPTLHQQQPTAPLEVTIPKPETEDLRTTALGPDDDSKAQKIITALNKLMMKKQDDCTIIPTKQTIFAGMARLDASIKKATVVFEEQEKALEDIKPKERHDEKGAKDSEVLGVNHNSELETLMSERQPELIKEIESEREKLEDELAQARHKGVAHLDEVVIKEQIDLVSKEYDEELDLCQNEINTLNESVQIAEKDMTALESEVKDERPDHVAQIYKENQRKAAEAHASQWTHFVSDGEDTEEDERLRSSKDPIHQVTHQEWAERAQQVTGKADALYAEPYQAPYFAFHEQNHKQLEPVLLLHVQHQQELLKQHWLDLGEEYLIREEVYRADHQNDAKKSKSSKSVAVRQSIMGGSKPPILETRTSTNPYRRARREVRTEYEQEQIIAELTAKEAMEKRIATGGSELPRQVGQLERSLMATFIQTFTAQKVDPMEEQRDLEASRSWSDVEKCIFLDRFLQYPKDFRKIASFLKSKTTTQCVEFYYDSKQVIPYKVALKEHIMRRKRRGDYHVWDASIQAALAVGAVVEAGPDEDKPLVFSLPADDHTYSTHNLHPMKRDLFNSMADDDSLSVLCDEHVVDAVGGEDCSDKANSRKRQGAPLFLLDAEQRKFLKPSPFEVAASLASNEDNGAATSSKGSSPKGGDTGDFQGSPKPETPTPLRKPPQKWTAEEKRMFQNILDEHGRDWNVLEQRIGTKTISQIKNYYYDNKKQRGRQRASEKKADTSAASVESAVNPPNPPQPSVPMPQMDLSGGNAGFAGHFETQYAPEIQQQILELLQREQQSRSLEAERLLELRQGELTQQQQDHWAQQAALTNQLPDEVARQLLQQHTQPQPQQLLSNLLPWISTGHQQASAQGSASVNQDWEQLQALMQLQQQQAQLSSLDAHGTNALSSLAGLNPSALFAHHHPQAPQVVPRQQGQNALSRDEAQLALAHHLLGYQGGNASNQGTLDLLAALSRNSGGGNNPPDNGRQDRF